MPIYKRPLFLFVAAYIAGILLSQAAWGLVLAAGLSLIALAFTKPRERAYVVLLALVFMLGFLRTSILSHPPADDVSQYAEDKLVHLSGRVASDPQVMGNRTIFTIDTEHITTYVTNTKAEGKVLAVIFTGQGNRAPFYGERVRIHGRLSVPEKGSYAKRKIFCTIAANTEDMASISPPGRSLMGVVAGFRNHLQATAGRYLSPVETSLLLGLLLGNNADLPLDVQSAFARSGTLHLLAASGYNCSLLAGMIGFLLCRFTATRTLRHLLLIGALWAFTLLAGSGPSIVRAATMATVFLLAYIVRRAPDTTNTVLVSALIILGANPLALWDVGFQLSFLAVLSIVIAIPLIPTLRLAKEGSSFRWACDTLLSTAIVSIVVTIGTWPVIAYYFNYFSIVSIIANIFTALIVAGMTVTGVSLLVIGSFLPAAGHTIAFFHTLLSSSMIGIVTELSAPSWAAISVRTPNLAFVVCYYIALYIFADYAHRKIAKSKRVAAAD